MSECHPQPAEVRPAWEFTATGTRWRLFHSGELPETVVDRVVEAVAQDEARWSRFREDSELSALNRRAGRWTPVSPETFALLELCARWMRLTGGLFTPLMGATLAAWGYAESLELGPAGSATSPRPGAVGGAIELDRSRQRVRIPPGRSLDLGGVGKGWIADRVCRLLSDLAAGHAVLVDAGGDLVCVDGGALVAIEAVSAGPGSGILGYVRLEAGEGIATSGFSRRSWVNGDGRAAHHLLDPRTGEPGPRTHATVLASDAVTADVMAKVLALAPERLDDCEFPALIQLDGEVRLSPRWRFVQPAVA